MSLDGKGCAEAYNHGAVVLGTIIICHINPNVLYLFRPDLYPVRYWCNDPIFPRREKKSLILSQNELKPAKQFFLCRAGSVQAIG